MVGVVWDKLWEPGQEPMNSHRWPRMANYTNAQQILGCSGFRVPKDGHDLFPYHLCDAEHDVGHHFGVLSLVPTEGVAAGHLWGRLAHRRLIPLLDHLAKSVNFDMMDGEYLRAEAPPDP